MTAVKIIPLETLVTLLEESDVQGFENLGATLVSSALHPVFGSIILINGSFDEHCAVVISKAHVERFQARALM